jgi:hypothetical protein
MLSASQQAWLSDTPWVFTSSISNPPLTSSVTLGWVTYVLCTSAFSSLQRVCWVSDAVMPVKYFRWCWHTEHSAVLLPWQPPLTWASQTLTWGVTGFHGVRRVSHWRGRRYYYYFFIFLSYWISSYILWEKKGMLSIYLFIFVVLGFELRDYTLSHSTSPLGWWSFFLGDGFFRDRVLWTICLGLTLNHDLPDICLLSSWDYRCESGAHAC